ncbi:MAG: TIGR04211 family SH3 domain-containing protein [Gammaproteobacteria bacterium]|nr:TIGR04211 family SH3 domain-containing protein [Gammaproteobacteria bacterium]
MAVILILGITQSVLADTVYIRDTIYVPLRGGQSTEHRILHRGVRSGTALDRLETNEDSGYSLVRMGNGLEGWIQSQYLVDEPIAKDLLQRTNDRLFELEADHQKTLLRLKEMESNRVELADSNDSLQDRNEALTKELTSITQLAASVIAIDDENKQLRDEHDSLLAQIDALSVANQELQDTSDQQWFLGGAGTVLLGLLFGFWISRRVYHKNNNSGWA